MMERPSRAQTRLPSYRINKDLTAVLPITGQRSYHTPVHGYFRGDGPRLSVFGSVGECLSIDSTPDICNQRQDSMSLIGAFVALLALPAFADDFYVDLVGNGEPMASFEDVVLEGG